MEDGYRCYKGLSKALILRPRIYIVEGLRV